MALAPLTNIIHPSMKEMQRLCIATADVTAGGGSSPVTITLDPAYPPIDRSIPCPILAIIGFQTGATLVANGIENALITGTCPSGTIDTAGTFNVTGDRTISWYQSANTAQAVLVAYIGRGHGNKR